MRCALNFINKRLSHNNFYSFFLLFSSFFLLPKLMIVNISWHFAQKKQTQEKILKRAKGKYETKRGRRNGQQQQHNIWEAFIWVTLYVETGQNRLVFLLYFCFRCAHFIFTWVWLIIVKACSYFITD